jgi:hypothetical protein
MISGSLKQRTVSGILWSFSDSIAGQLVQFIVGLILARILTPSEFGLIAMITVFLAVSQSFVDSGFETVTLNKTNYFTNPKIIASKINEDETVQVGDKVIFDLYAHPTGPGDWGGEDIFNELKKV